MVADLRKLKVPDDGCRCCGVSGQEQTHVVTFLVTDGGASGCRRRLRLPAAAFRRCFSRWLFREFGGKKGFRLDVLVVGGERVRGKRESNVETTWIEINAHQFSLQIFNLLSLSTSFLSITSFSIDLHLISLRFLCPILGFLNLFKALCRSTLLANSISSMSTSAMRANSHDSSSQEQSLDRDTQSDEVLSEEEDDVSKETHNSVSYFPSDTYGQQGHQNFQPEAPNILPRNEETLSQPPQLDLANHSVACASNPYYDPYYGGMMAAAYGQHLVHPQFLDVHQVRMPLPLEMAQEPVYVNAKQYHAILRRRQSRAKAELEKKLIKDRKPYLHESRHQHAMRRVRSSGGRFAKKTESDALKHDKNATSSGMKRVHSEPAVTFGAHQEPRGGMVNSCNGGARYDSQDSFQEGGGSLGQQWTTIPSNQNPQRAVAMK